MLSNGGPLPAYASRAHAGNDAAVIGAGVAISHCCCPSLLQAIACNERIGTDRIGESTAVKPKEAEFNGALVGVGLPLTARLGRLVRCSSS
jgi:hypothetical protein